MVIPGTATLAALRPRASLPPLWHELAMLRRVAGSPAGDRPTALAAAGRGPVVLVPGLLAGDGSLARLHAYLEREGHPVHGSGIRCNVDCSESASSRLLDRVAAIADLHGEPVTIVGHSRGGLLARVVMQREPDAVAGVVTLGTPHRDQLAVHPLLWAQLVAIAALRSAGVSRLLGVSCAAGSCCEGFRRDLAAPPPAGVGLVSIYSRRDGVVDWRACIDANAWNVEVPSAHCEMAVDPRTFAVVASAAARFAGPRRLEPGRLAA